MAPRLPLAVLALLLVPMAGPALALDNVPDLPPAPGAPPPPAWLPGPPGMPTLPPAPEVQVPEPPACLQLPECALSQATPVVERAEQTVGPWVDLFTPLIALALPDSGNDLLLMGKGHATATVNGRTGPCEGESHATVEASRKSFNLEPSMTIAYDGALGQEGFLLPCFMGQRAQPSYRELQPGSVWPEGPWTAVKVSAEHVWSLSVSAPAANGTHYVQYHYSSPDGTNQGTFEGWLLDYR
ncbi:MAG TPA: hypothetical protein VGR28_08725 [Candidatus Thermoplasmatota archaeon]|jgi:hypothetical protein|nr:hypothetical protein [Candidatus Thermoplasmatota archaeon]